MFGGGPPEQGGPVVASFEAWFIPDKPGEFTVLVMMLIPKNKHFWKKLTPFASEDLKRRIQNKFDLFKLVYWFILLVLHLHLFFSLKIRPDKWESRNKTLETDQNIRKI